MHFVVFRHDGLLSLVFHIVDFYLLSKVQLQKGSWLGSPLTTNVITLQDVYPNHNLRRGQQLILNPSRRIIRPLIGIQQPLIGGLLHQLLTRQVLQLIVLSADIDFHLDLPSIQL